MITITVLTEPAKKIKKADPGISPGESASAFGRPERPAAVAM